MKKLLIPISFCLLILTSATAQEKRGGEKKQQAKNEKGHINKQLDLSDDQKSKMKSINEKYREQTKALKSNDDITRGDFKKQMGDLNEKRKAEVAATLTPDQKNKMKEIKENKQKEMKEKATARFEKMSSKLQLNEKQKATLLTERKNTEAQIKSLKENKSLSEVQKKEQIKSLKEKQKETLKSILTDEQKAKFEHQKKDKVKK